MNLPSKSSDWIISQLWSELLFINYSISPTQIQDRLPNGVEVDTFQGKAYLSIVPFKMSGIRFKFTPTLPFSSFWELNIRTYVKVGSSQGIYFFTLDASHRLGTWIAKTFFALPYRYQSFKGTHGDLYEFHHKNIQISASIGEALKKGDFENWISERYSLFTDKGKKIYQGVAQHAPWELKQLKFKSLEQDFLDDFGFHNYNYVNAYYGGPLDVRFRPFTQIR